MILRDDAKIFFTFGGILYICFNGIKLKIPCNLAPFEKKMIDVN